MRNFLICAVIGGQLFAQDAIHFSRNYTLGEHLKYEMKGSNQGWEYQLDASIAVKQDEGGSLYEEIGWSNLKSNAPMTLSAESLAFRQRLSLDRSGKYLAIPDLSKVQPMLIGPITDMLTFYSDVLLAKRLDLAQVGQHGYFEHGTPNSWADGQRILVGKDAIDFDLTLLSANAQEHTVTLLAKHVPPKHSQIEFPVEWMKTPVADSANNWLQVEKAADKYIAQVGKETFEAKIVLDSRDGKILSVSMHNPVNAVSRECADAELSHCGAASPKNNTREVSLQWLR